MSAIILEGEIVHYEVLGRGRPVFFLHGWVGSWRYWIPAMQAASMDFRTYAIDFWGFGGTAKDTDHYTLLKQRDLLNNFMYEMGIDKVALIGHGLGAVVALMFAEAYSSYVDRIMAIGLPFETSMVNPRLKQSRPDDLADWLIGTKPENQAVRIEGPKADPEVVPRTINNLNSIGLTDLPYRIKTPCVLINGLNDPAISHPRADQLENLQPHLHHVTFNNSGHFPMLDQPSKFNRLMNDFLALESDESPNQLQLKEEWKRRLR